MRRGARIGSGGCVARQNIDEKWKTDPRRTALANRIGGRNADGMRVEINWLILSHKGHPVPLKEFKFVEAWQDWIDCGLGEIDGDAVHMAGADEYEEFFKKQRTNGSKGGRQPKPKKTQTNPTVTQTNPNNPSSSSSFSFSVSKKEKKTNTGKAPALPPQPPVDVNLVQVYCDEWRAKTGRSPTIRPKEAGQLSRFAKDLGSSRALAILKAYFAMPNPYYLRKGWSVDILLSDLAAIQQFEATGKVVTGAVVHELEKRVDKVQGTGRRRSLVDLVADEPLALMSASGGDNDGAA